MQKIWIVTGAAGHLGQNIVQQLVLSGARVRGLLREGEPAPAGIEVVRGDVCKPESLQALFTGLQGMEIRVVHTAAIIDITSKVSAGTRDVNIGGTRNLVELCLHHNVYRFVYVSSVHAIPEAPGRQVMREIRHFSALRVRGGYAKTKAEATRFVLGAVVQRGLPAVVLLPSGIIGPLDPGHNNLMNVLRSFVAGRLRVCPKGGYNLVDVRDVAAACIAAADKGRVGESYILSGKHMTMTELSRMTGQITGRGGLCTEVPNWVVRVVAPLTEKWALCTGRAPLVTPYALHALGSNDNFNHDKASRELGYHPRNMEKTLQDTIDWLREAEPELFTVKNKLK